MLFISAYDWSRRRFNRYSIRRHYWRIMYLSRWYLAHRKNFCSVISLPKEQKIYCYNLKSCTQYRYLRCFNPCELLIYPYQPVGKIKKRTAARLPHAGRTSIRDVNVTLKLCHHFRIFWKSFSYSFPI